MNEKLSDLLGIFPSDTVQLSRKLRDRLLRFLLLWDHYAEAEACLDVLIPAYPELVSLLDARARLQLKTGAPIAALNTLRVRHENRVSMSSQAMLAQVLLALGEADRALDLALEMRRQNPEKLTPYGILGEIHLARGEYQEAESAFRGRLALSEDNREALLGLMAVDQARGDWVSATAHAVRAQTAGDNRPVTTEHLRRLLDFYREAGEQNRAIDAESTLQRRYERALAELRKALVEESPGTPRPAAVREVSPRVRVQDKTPPLQLPSPAAPSEEERRRIQAGVRKYFGFERLLPGQMETIAAVMRGEDLLTVLPTGGGKSLCYQLPAIMDGRGTTLVISPLIALMKDQLDSLPPAVGRAATALNSSLEGDELRKRLQRLAKGAYRLVYAAPERLRQPPFVDALKQGGLNRLVIDEAHCVSMWGHDFRPDYLAIGQVRRMLGNPPLLAMTATAPERVRRDIVQRMGAMNLVAADIHRPNLRLEVVQTRSQDEKLQHLLHICQSEAGPGIVYAGTRARCEELAATLHHFGVDAGHYHAGIPNRAAVQDGFMSGRVQVMVATVAFGLGIDKADIRYIVHYVPPPSLESYYQEAGRAGRDGRPSRCILFFSNADKGTLSRRAGQDQLSIEFLREVYQAVRRRLGAARIGRVACDDLCRDIPCEETGVRVALGLLESAGLLRRHLDAPRGAVVTLKREAEKANDAQLQAFCDAARLRTGQALEVDLIKIAFEAALDPTTIEMQVLYWKQGDWVDYRPAGRDLLLERLPAPENATNQVTNLLERHASMGVQRVEDITSYARTTRCRHGFISAYLGGRSLSNCGACDNCLGLKPAVPKLAGFPEEKEQLQLILRCLSETRAGIGRVSLINTLRANPKAPAWTLSLSCQGALRHRSSTAIDKLVERLVDDGFLQAMQLSHGGSVLKLTARGKAALDNPKLLD